MSDFKTLEKHNLKVLGVIVRVKRMKLGYSLRDLAQLTNISHTLISNFEKGQLTPHSDTIKDIFRVLNLSFIDDPEISINFKKLYKKAFKHILFYEYDEAGKIMKEIENDKKIYENSPEVINYAIIQCLYYSISDIYFEQIDTLFSQYEVALGFFSDKQRQLFYFIKGLDYINKESFAEARYHFEKALSVGDPKLNLLINEYYIIALSKANKFVDARLIAEECISKFESKINYVRAMRLRTRIAYDYTRMKMYPQAEKLYKEVLEYSMKYNIKDLVNRCNTRLSLQSIKRGDFIKAEEYIKKVTPNSNKLYHYIMFDIVFNKKNDEEFIELYNEYISLDWVLKSQKAKLFFELIKMRYDEKYLDKKRYESNLKKLSILGLKSDDGEMIEVVCNMQIDFFTKERKYKQALEASVTLLHYIKNGVEDNRLDSNINYLVYK